MQTQHTISIVGKNELAREGLKRILIEDGFPIHCVVASHSELADIDPDKEFEHIVLCDVTTTDAVGIARAIRSRFQFVRIVFMIDDVSIQAVAAAFGEGIDGYFVNSISCEPLKSALRLVATGEKVFPSQLASVLTPSAWTHPTETLEIDSGLNLSAREIEILRCLMDGKSNKVIARQLQITEATVKVHVKAVLRKLHVANRTQAAIWAFTRGLTEEKSCEAGPQRPALPALPSAVPGRTRPQLQAIV